MTATRYRIGRAAALSAAMLTLATLLAACSQPEPTATARIVTQRGDLLGGPRALGDVGDILMENDEVRVVIQSAGFSRGFGVYGGSLIDAAIRPARETSNAARLPVQDAFGELFPAFLLQAVNVEDVTILSDGSDGGPAIVEAVGFAGDFLEIAGFLNRLAIGSNESPADPSSDDRVRYRTRYELAPGAKHVAITFIVENISDEALVLPTELATTLLGVLEPALAELSVPIGDVSLFGNNMDVFMPGIGFDVRFGLAEQSAVVPEPPAFAGILTPFVAARDGHASYGLLAEPSERNFAYNLRENYGERGASLTTSSMLVPFVASGFLGIFYDSAPMTLPAGEALETRKYFIIGDGDVASVYDEMLSIRGEPFGTLGGEVLDLISGAAATDVDAIVYTVEDDTLEPFVQVGVFEGRLRANLPPGDYAIRVFGAGRLPSEPTPFTIREGRLTGVQLGAPGAGRVVANVVDTDGAALPAKVTVVGQYDPAFAGEEPRTFLFDLEAGESFLTTDFVVDNADDPSTLQYIESFGFTKNGRVTIPTRPGTYDVYVSRGPEYDIVQQRVTVEAGGVGAVDATLERVMDTEGWISMDVHMHSINSIDSGLDLDTRVLQVAAEGIEWAVATDHNYVTDYEPYILRNGLYDWMQTSSGLELTTLESGHFNGYPLNFEPGPITHGAFEWSGRPPSELFAALRSRAKYGPEEMIVQVNHPRDSITGYFNQYDRDGLTAEFNDEPSGLDRLIATLTDGGEIDVFSGAFFELDEEGNYLLNDEEQRISAYAEDFDALEILNGKLFWTIHHFRDETGAIVRDDGEVTFPGAVDDWYNLLNLGHRYIGVASSDSHGASDEIGYFRTMVQVPDDTPRAVSERALIAAMRERRVIGTNGPMLDLTVAGTTIGQETVATTPTVPLRIELTVPTWMSVGRINIIRNGVIAEAIEVDAEADYSRTPLVIERDIQLATDPETGATIDAWYLVEAIGYEDLFPIVRPAELPPIDLTNALGSIAGALGLDLVGEGEGPSFLFAITPYAITNPIWVRTEADREWMPPGIVPFAERSAAENDPGFDPDPAAKHFLVGERIDPQPLRYVDAARWERSLPEGLFHREPESAVDVRRAIQTFGHH
jgi:hypothetical protein